MENKVDLNKAKKSIKEIFSYLKIERVICVDDQYDTTPTMEKFKNSYGNLRRVEQLPSFLQEATSGDQDLEDIELEKYWKQLSLSEQNSLLQEMDKKIDPENDTIFAKTLKSLLQPYGLQELSASQWRNRKSKLVEEAKTCKTLFLFDQDFRGEGGSSEEGFKLIKDLFESSQGNFPIHCGLLSHTFQVEDEYQLLGNYAKEYPNFKDNFIFISKSQLRDDPSEFARRIKITTISPMCKDLKKASATVIERAHEDAIKKIDLIDIYDFEQMVFQSSILEGVWEPDTLFRLFGIYHRNKARELARTDSNLHVTAAYVRNLNSISTRSALAPKSRAWEVRRFELYEEKEYINGLHMPIELGDIFEIKEDNKSKKFILLAQPCDLMVRKNGRRKQSVTEAILAEIIPSGSNDLGNRDANGNPVTTDAFYELSYFDGTGKTYFVSFQRKHSIKLSILDLCAYQVDGSARLNLNSTCPTHVIPTWQKHYEELVSTIKSFITQYQEICGYCQNISAEEQAKVLALARANILMLPTSFSSNNTKNLFAGDINPSEQSVMYELERSGRLCSVYSTALLAKFAAFLARTAFEHDFGYEAN